MHLAQLEAYKVPPRAGPKPALASGLALWPAELHTEDMGQHASRGRIGSFLTGQCTLTSRAKE